MVRRFVLPALLALSLPALAHAAELDWEKLRALQAGTATKADVRKALGEPSKERPSSNGSSMLLYDFKGAKLNADVTADVTAVVLFDDAGKLLRIRVFETADVDAATQP